MKNNISLDPTITQEEMKAYGYTWPGMIPLRKKKAIELFQAHPIFKLYEDGSEGEVESMDDLLDFAKEGGIFGVEAEQFQQEDTVQLNTLEGCNILYQWLQGKADDKFCFKSQPNLTADEAFSVIYYLQEKFHVIPDTIKKCSICDELYDSNDKDVPEDDTDEESAGLCCGNCAYDEDDIRNIEVFYRRDDRVVISKKELIQLVEDGDTNEIIRRFRPGYIPGCTLEELAEDYLDQSYFKECGAKDIEIF